MKNNFTSPIAHQKYLEILSKMSPDEKIKKVFELNEMAKDLFIAGLKQTFPEKNETEITELYLERIKLCHNRNY